MLNIAFNCSFVTKLANLPTALLVFTTVAADARIITTNFRCSSSHWRRFRWATSCVSTSRLNWRNSWF